jgi:CHAT domain-containing protein
LTEEDKNIILELDGTLASVPMQALVSAEGRYFGDRFSVLISTGYSMSREMAVTGRKANVLVVANPQVTGDHADQFPPLPETLVEAEAVRAVFPASTILEGPHATLDAFKRHLPDADVVHFAGHGYSGSGNGGLLFAARSPGEDYQLLVSADLRGQEWSRCRLAVLSACAVAKGETRGPHNPDSLVRALTKAGVARVLASLWSVDSAATGQLMRVFYASLAQGIGPADALRIAQQWVRQQPGWEHPYYWAGFQLYGTV